MQHDVQLIAGARLIYPACYPDEDCAPFNPVEAARRGSYEWGLALEAARAARGVFVEEPVLL